MCIVPNEFGTHSDLGFDSEHVEDRQSMDKTSCRQCSTSGWCKRCRTRNTTGYCPYELRYDFIFRFLDWSAVMDNQ